MNKKMLIDATHSEETRVAVVLDDNRLDDFDFENTVRKTLKGNIYLVKVTRVEPSLQAAFVDFGGNRHGFLPFPEIHPDYYRIPIADREALIADQQGDDIVEENDEDQNEADNDKKGKSQSSKKDGEEVEYVGGEEDIEDTPTFKRTNLKHRYKIQEVIKRNQIMLIQVNKEERGNKGAAVSSYISLPGRYCVLMPNSPRAGGVSRKVSNQADRTRLKKILGELNVPEGMSVIIRTAGISRTKAEIKRDFEYLMRLWDKIRDLTLKSTAPELVHEEGDLIKRAIRDLYRREISEILVEGEEGYKRARDFMKMLMPSHARRVTQYKNNDGVPLFFNHHVEKQIDEIYSIEVRLKSGGYIVINPTEALISIDVNSGKATKGRHIEETALRTNIEAAEEVARQLRLRDLGGLVVIDFIDMEENKNNRIVERHLKDAMQRDRARIQFGRISAFGLLELSRQRMRPSLVETNFELCSHCHGVGVVRTIETSAAVALRAIEEEGLHNRADVIKVTLNQAVALYIFNNKRNMLSDIEKRYNMRVCLEADHNLVKPDYKIDIEEERKSGKPLIDMSAPVFKDTSSSQGSKPNDDHNEEDDDGNRNRRRRRSRRGGRRRGRRNNDNNDQNHNGNNNEPKDKAEDNNKNKPTDNNKADTADDKNESGKAEDQSDKKSSRGRKTTRGKGRSRKKDDSNVNASKEEAVKSDTPSSDKETKKPAPKSKSAGKNTAKKSDTSSKEKTAAPKNAKKKKGDTEKNGEVVKIEDKKSADNKPAPSNDSGQASEKKSDNKSKKKGWWQRLTE